MAQKRHQAFSSIVLFPSVILIQSILIFQVSSMGSVQISIPQETFSDKSETYHKHCTDNSTCSIHAWDFTKCDTINKFCICLEDEKMYYDTFRKTCVVYAGRTCTSFTVSTMPCTEGATCVTAHPSYTCKCDNAIPPEEGLCVKTHFEECLPEHHHRCSAQRGLICDNGNCTCVQEGVTHAWSPEVDMCVGLADVGTCNSTTGKIGCIPGADCVGETCRCSTGYSVTYNHRCKLSLNTTCYQNPTEEWETCNENYGLVCLSSVCSCQSGTVYDGINYRCSAAVNQTCDLKPDDVPFFRNCVPGSKCVLADNGQGVCQCDQGYSPVTDNSSCVKGGNSDSSKIGSNVVILLVTLTVIPHGLGIGLK